MLLSFSYIVTCYHMSSYVLSCCHVLSLSLLVLKSLLCRTIISNLLQMHWLILIGRLNQLSLVIHDDHREHYWLSFEITTQGLLLSCREETDLQSEFSRSDWHGGPFCFGSQLETRVESHTTQVSTNGKPRKQQHTLSESSVLVSWIFGNYCNLNSTQHTTDNSSLCQSDIDNISIYIQI